MQKINDLFKSPGLFSEENLSLPEGSLLETGQVVFKIHGFLNVCSSFFQQEPHPNVSLANALLKTRIYQTSKRTKRAFVTH